LPCSGSRSPAPLHPKDLPTQSQSHHHRRHRTHRTHRTHHRTHHHTHHRRFTHIPLVASLAGGLSQFRESLGVALVDAVLEDIR
jgi:hypothetical protein